MSDEVAETSVDVLLVFAIIQSGLLISTRLADTSREPSPVADLAHLSIGFRKNGERQ